MFELKLRGVPTDTLDYEKMAALTEGYNGADITEFCEKLKLDAIKKTVTSGSEHLITMEEVMSVRERTHSSVSQEDLEQLREFEGSV
jgi:transitional endoplasmic reticulum ATPase